MPEFLKNDTGIDDNPLWYKDAVIYELHVRSFYDSDGDGTGDVQGLTEKLDYLQDLGVTAVWLLPFYPSPLRDDGYDISQYTSIHPSYGSLSDFRRFLHEAHRRGIRVITEMVLNHTSDQHPWFQRARTSKPGSVYRDFYVWSDTPEKYHDARIIFKDYETANWSWDSTAHAYYWHRFYSHQPDLNFDNPRVQKSILQVIDFWFKMGVDGLRFDAVPYLFEREGTNCENLPETHEFIRTLRAHIDANFTGKMLLAEANQWPEDASEYFGRGDQFHMAYHFPLMPRLFMGVRMEDRFPIIDILEQTPAIPDDCQWVIFLRNHDELTLEMVTDEERDYMYRAYANDPQMRINLGIRRRLAPLLGNHRRRMELMNGLLLSLPGTPVIYYGDEIGMGDNIYLGDRNGVRTPMQWSDGRNAGFSSANPQKLFLPVIIDPEYHFDAVNVEVQQNNTHSMLWWMKRLIALRKRYKAFGHGSLRILPSGTNKVLTFMRERDGENILVAANLSRFAQYVKLDLSAHQGMAPVELFGRTEFPVVGSEPYFLNLGPHSFYWFSLEKPRAGAPAKGKEQTELPVIAVRGEWDAVFTGQSRHALEEALPAYLMKCRWFTGKGRHIKDVVIRETIPLPNDGSGAVIAIMQVSYIEEETDSYLLPLAFNDDASVRSMCADRPCGCIARLSLKSKKEQGILYDAVFNKDFCTVLLQAIGGGRSHSGARGRLTSSPTRMYSAISREGKQLNRITIPKADQDNTSIIYGDSFILKLFRRLAPGVNPDLEIGRVLTERSFPHIPPLAGDIEYLAGRQYPIQVGILRGYVKNEGDAWKLTLDHVGDYFERSLAITRKIRDIEIPEHSLIQLSQIKIPATVLELIGPYAEWARLIGKRTAELHLALAESSSDPDFAPEPFSKLYQRSLYQSLRSLAIQTFDALEMGLPDLPSDARDKATGVLTLKDEVLERYRLVMSRPIDSLRIRCHGDYHLGQLLFTGKDFQIIDFEGEPSRSLSERRIKRSPFRDAAAMIRSFYYAAWSSAGSNAYLRDKGPENHGFLVQLWHRYVSAIFLAEYLHTAGDAQFVPQDRASLEILLHSYLLDKAVYELGFELLNRPGWIDIPLRSIRAMLDEFTRSPQWKEHAS